MKLKPITAESIPRALEKAERYRFLNEPRESESICLDILAIDPKSQPAIACLLLSLTDQFGELSGAVERARQLLARVDSDYERAYYAGIISERFGKRQLQRDHPGSGSEAFEYLREAMKHFERAEELAPDGNDDAILRYNACVRLMASNPSIREAPRSDPSDLIE